VNVGYTAESHKICKPTGTLCLLYRLTVLCYEIKWNLLYILSQFSIFIPACLSNNGSLLYKHKPWVTQNRINQIGFVPGVRAPLYKLNWSLGGSQNTSGHFGESKIVLLLTGSELRLLCWSAGSEVTTSTATSHISGRPNWMKSQACTHAHTEIKCGVPFRC